MPGPAPKYQPTFRKEELKNARTIFLRRKSPNGEARRARLVLLLEETPELGNSEAARILGVHRNTVLAWRKRWAEKGFELCDKPRSGRPRAFSPSDHHDDQEHRM